MEIEIPYKLTSVKIIDGNYLDLKINISNTDITLQKIVNRCVDLYNKDEEFRNKIDNHMIYDLNNLKY